MSYRWQLVVAGRALGHAGGLLGLLALVRLERYVDRVVVMVGGVDARGACGIDVQIVVVSHAFPLVWARARRERAPQHYRASAA
ncbi:MAG: hypothetical protein JWL76_1504 [Thermoleophilia bacterium]|nr:hypothetical protein [Thermoleophilia bacterium]